jgi:hypothetical protein
VESGGGWNGGGDDRARDGGLDQYGEQPGPGGPAADDFLQRLRAQAEGAAPSGETVRCRFLRSIGPDGQLSEPQDQAVPYHRCAAFGDPLPLSLRQQELVCLQRVHVSCPRYLRGTVLANEDAVAEPDEEKRPRRRGIFLIALLLALLAVAILAAGPVMGILPFGGPAAPAATPTVALSPSPVFSPSPSPKATASRTPAPSPTATATPTATPVPSATWPAGATASRMNLLTVCPDQANCWLYTVRSAAQNGSSVDDTLQGVATYFGVSVAGIRALNASLATTDVITPGQVIKIPPPTR